MHNYYNWKLKIFGAFKKLKIIIFEYFILRSIIIYLKSEQKVKGKAKKLGYII